uniref:Uncharacterized protein n=1 Tax=Leviviridae sp. TaxID=2027243 RepID=A0A142D852_9VIRU|nr:hypothetical protein [Leviviridae sp.]
MANSTRVRAIGTNNKKQNTTSIRHLATVTGKGNVTIRPKGSYNALSTTDRQVMTCNTVYLQVQNVVGRDLGINFIETFSGLLTPYAKTNSADIRSNYMEGIVPILYANNGIFTKDVDKGFHIVFTDMSEMWCYTSFSTLKNFYGYAGKIVNVVWDKHEAFLRRLKVSARNLRVRKLDDIVIKVQEAVAWTPSGYPSNFTTTEFTPVVIGR